ncbi:hypothetical protein Ancab_040525 [Ancistrocladus abbreviatus]
MAPIFSKILRKTDVKNRLSWPIEQLHLIMQIPTSCKVSLEIPTSCKVPFLVADDFGNLWEFICSTRDGDYLKPVIIGEWMTFARAKTLEVGDQLMFYEHKDPTVRFLVQVQRLRNPPLRLFGANIERYPIHG